MINPAKPVKRSPFVRPFPLSGTLLANQVVKFFYLCLQMEMIQFFLSDKRNLAGQFAYAVFSGVCGTLILVVFLNAMLNVFQVIKIVPFIVAFNTAMTGYSLIDKCRERIRRKHAWALSAGLLTAVITVGLLMTFSLYFLAENLFGLKLSLFLIIIGAVCSELGALLAAKYFKIK